MLMEFYLASQNSKEIRSFCVKICPVRSLWNSLILQVYYAFYCVLQELRRHSAKWSIHAR
jgi:hypothetical protein